MKKILLGFTAAAALSAMSARAEISLDLQKAVQSAMLSDINHTAQNMINWKVGDYQKIKLTMAFGGGDGRKEATKEDTTQNAVWLVETVSLMGQEQKTEALISRTDGKTIKLIVNGKEEDPNSGGDVKIISQEETTVTVAAGTFDCLHVKAQMTSQGQTTDVELWANPVDVNLDGMLKLVMQSQFGPITMELTEFGPKK